ncbi:hypothetical protein VTL71DRAFT_1431 [Oculimacula yallundae]|uniref:Secreted protein n=1 Tax=Oculimacula yallundae TaxID=86028 RepID=A0ABR4CBU7_9HELO
MKSGVRSAAAPAILFLYFLLLVQVSEISERSSGLEVVYEAHLHSLFFWHPMVTTHHLKSMSMFYFFKYHHGSRG